MKILSITSRSVTLELENNTAYLSEKPFHIVLGGKVVREENRNVFSLFSLMPSTSYTVEVNGEKTVFKTEEEVCVFNVKNFGAKGDGKHDDTPAFTAAINCLPPRSTLYIPASIYFLKPVFIKSDITVYFEKGAKIIADTDREGYPVLPALEGGENAVNLGTWQGEEADCFASIFYSYNQSNFSIIGEGEIDCLAPEGDWYINHRIKRGAWRPRGIFFNRCTDVLVAGITVKNTPSWNIHPYFCNNVKLYDLTLENPSGMPTTDGIDPDACDTVDIAGVKISVGDDCIAIKSGTFEFAKKYRAACKNIFIRNCLMREGHGGVVLGSELSGGIENVIVTKCIFEGTDRGLRIKTRRGRGRIGKCNNVAFSDIVMKNVKVPFVVNMYYNMGDENGHTEYVWTTEKLPVDELTPEIGSFVFENMICTGTEYCAAAFFGLPEAPINQIVFKNVSFTYNRDCSAGFPDMREKNVAYKNAGLIFEYVQSVTLENVTVSGQAGGRVIFKEVEKFNEIGK